MAAIDRVRRATQLRQETTIDALKLRRAVQAPALASTAGKILPLGASGAIPPRGVTAGGGLAAGQPVGTNQGIITGQPDAPTTAALISQSGHLQRAISEIASVRGIKAFDGDPNDSGAPAYQDFNYQLLWRTDTNQFYYWSPSDGTTAGAWELIVAGRLIQDEGVELPTQPSLNFVGDGVTATNDATNNTTVVTIPGGGGGGNAGTIFYAEAGATEVEAGTSNRDLLIYFDGVTFGAKLARWGGDAWYPFDYCGGSNCDTSPPTPPTGYNVTEILAIYITGAGPEWEDGCSREAAFGQGFGIEIDPGSESFTYVVEDLGNGSFNEIAQVNYTLNGVAQSHNFYDNDYDTTFGEQAEGPYSLCGQQYEYSRYYRE